MIRRTLRLAKSLITTAVALALFPPAPEAAKAAARERFEKRVKVAGPGPGFVASHRRPEVPRPVVSWWLGATAQEKADMRAALRLALGRPVPGPKRPWHESIADHRRRLHVLEEKRERHRFEMRAAAGTGTEYLTTVGWRSSREDVPASIAALRLHIARLDFEILRQQCILRDMRNRERRWQQHRAARKQAAQVAASAGAAMLTRSEGVHGTSRP